MGGNPQGTRAGRESPSGDDLERVRRRLAEAMAQVCPHWLAGDREDLVQAALVRIVGLRGGRLDPGDLALTYLWKTAHSVMLDEIRRARWKYERTSGSEHLGNGMPAPTQDPERDAVSREVATQIHACLRTLEPSRRRAVVLHLTGFARHEIAALLEKSVKQIDNLIHRGTRDLRACLESKGVRP
ncbi:MAG TPA: sigma-70 family RNA polymerase sigma factor [Candidatus Polarisedimenticolaceae bacterium]|nr:sigma-70 family RNA polymerase sigma factor [Candidatus Polarisedimenticolaceae bacterium]